MNFECLKSYSFQLNCYICMEKVDIIVNNVIGNTQDIEWNVFNFNFSKPNFFINNYYNRRMRQVKL